MADGTWGFKSRSEQTNEIPDLLEHHRTSKALSEQQEFVTKFVGN